MGTDNTPTRITLDKLQKKIPVHKFLRIQHYKDEYVKLAEYITPYMSNHDLSIFITKNDGHVFYSLKKYETYPQYFKETFIEAKQRALDNPDLCITFKESFIREYPSLADDN